jgi:hypothetical protein
MEPLLPQDGVMRRVVLALFAAVPLLFGVISLALGQDSNWDLRNYHWYDAYAALTGRLDLDMGAAQTPTYYNPTLDIPFYLAANALPARIFGFLLGALQGCNFILLYLLASRTLRLGDTRLQVLAAAIIAFIGMIGGGHLSQVGAIFYDNIVSLFVFGAMVVILTSADTLLHGAWLRALSRAVLAGLLVGFGVGLKLPTQIFAVGVCFGLLFIPGPFWRRLFLSFVCGLGVITGCVLFGGWWMLELWTHYGNPFFPYFNDVIRSPWALPESYRDARFLPKTLSAALALPFQIFLDGKAAGEIAFRDARVLGAYIMLLATPVMLLVRRMKATSAVDSEDAPVVDIFALRYLAAVAVLSYTVWLCMFGIYRYMISLEMLAPLLVAGCIGLWPVGRTRRFSLAFGMLGFLVVTVQAGTWGRIPWAPGAGGRFVDVDLPPIANPAATMVLMTGFAPTSFVIPALPPEVPVLRPYSFLIEPSHDTRFNKVMRQRIAAHQGDFLLVQPVWEKWAADKVLPDLGLDFDLAGCRPIQANLDNKLELCTLRRVAAP